jgi:hypothetical protein
MSPRLRNRRLWFPVLLALGLLLSTGLAAAASDEKGGSDSAQAEKPPTLAEALDLPSIPNARCLKCHNDEDEKTSEREDGTVINIYVDRERFEHSVHGKQPCVGCHNTVKKAIHEIRTAPVVSAASGVPGKSAAMPKSRIVEWRTGWIPRVRVGEIERGGGPPADRTAPHRGLRILNRASSCVCGCAIIRADLRSSHQPG